jgi:hypothetical protein
MAFAFGFNVGPKMLGVDFSTKHTTAQHRLGTECLDSKGRTMLYVKAGGTIEKGNLVKAAASATPHDGVLVATASATATFILGMAPQALASGDYAWIVEHGVFEDEAQLAAVAAGEAFVSDANGDCVAAAAADIENSRGVVLVDGGATGSVLLY